MPCRNSRRCSISRMGESGPDIGRRPAGDAYELVERRREDIVGMAASGPHLVEVGQVDVDDRPDGCRKT